MHLHFIVSLLECDERRILVRQILIRNHLRIHHSLHRPDLTFLLQAPFLEQVIQLQQIFHLAITNNIRILSRARLLGVDRSHDFSTRCLILLDNYVGLR